jgi:AcrR family transcriptional regulator
MSATGKRRGRPASFNREAALDAAAALFGRHGYEGTSLTMLTTALGCTAPTLYAAFGSKEGLYRETLAAYRRKEMKAPGGAPKDLSPYAMVERYLREAARRLADKDRPDASMVAVGSLHCAPGNEATSAAAAAARAEGLRDFIARLEEAERQGHFADRINAEAIAHFYTAVAQGLSVQAIDGATLDQLNAIVDMALAAWPRPSAERH